MKLGFEAALPQGSIYCVLLELSDHDMDLRRVRNSSHKTAALYAEFSAEFNVRLPYECLDVATDYYTNKEPSVELGKCLVKLHS